MFFIVFWLFKKALSYFDCRVKGCSTALFQKCSVDKETWSPVFQSARTEVDDDCISIFAWTAPVRISFQGSININTLFFFFCPQRLLWRLRTESNLCNTVLAQWFVPGDRDRRPVRSHILWLFCHHVTIFSKRNSSRQMCCVCRALRIWEPGKKGMVMQTKADRDSNGLCCDYHPQGGVVATG